MRVENGLPDRQTWLGLGVIVLIGLGLRLIYLHQDMRYDEAYTWLFYGSKPLSESLRTYTFPNNHLFHTLLVHLSTSVFGAAAWAIRLPALLAGLLVIPLTYRLGERLYDRRIGLWGAALMAVAPMMVAYSTDARGYTILTVCFLGMCLLGLRLLQAHSTAQPARLLWLGWIALGAIGLYAIPVMLYPLAVVTLWLAMAGLPERRVWWGKLVSALAAVGLLGGLLYLPVIQHEGLQALMGNAAVKRLAWHQWIVDFPASLLQTWQAWWEPFPPLWLGLPLGALAFLGCIRHGSMRRFAPILPAPLAVALPVLLLMVGLQQVAPFPRVWIFLLPLVALAMAVGLASLLPGFSKSRMSWLAVPVALAGAVFLAWIQPPLRDMQVMTATLAENARPGDRLMAPHLVWVPLAYHLQRGGLPYRLLDDHWAMSLAAVSPDAPVSSGRQDLLILPQGLSQEVFEALMPEVYRHTGVPFELATVYQTPRWAVFQVSPQQTATPAVPSGSAVPGRR